MIFKKKPKLQHFVREPLDEDDTWLLGPTSHTLCGQMLQKQSRLDLDPDTPMCPSCTIVNERDMREQIPLLVDYLNNSESLFEMLVDYLNNPESLFEMLLEQTAPLTARRTELLKVLTDPNNPILKSVNN